MICPYCKKKAIWTENKEVYNGKNYGHSIMIWLCKFCDAYIGCHNNTRRALGEMANKGLRKLRVRAKNLFIKVKLKDDWHCSTPKKNRAYHWLSSELGIKRKKTHFAMFGPGRCIQIINLLTPKSND